jgi:hypothetical protein
MAHKLHAIGLLNEHLRAQATTDEAIAGVIQLITDEWYWGDTGDLRAHMRGLREMIRFRGGFGNLGLNGLLSKLAITQVLLSLWLLLSLCAAFFLAPNSNGVATATWLTASRNGSDRMLRLPCRLRSRLSCKMAWISNPTMTCRAPFACASTRRSCPGSCRSPRVLKHSVYTLQQPPSSTTCASSSQRYSHFRTRRRPRSSRRCTRRLLGSTIAYRNSRLLLLQSVVVCRPNRRTRRLHQGRCHQTCCPDMVHHRNRRRLAGTGPQSGAGEGSPGVGPSRQGSGKSSSRAAAKTTETAQHRGLTRTG